MTIIILLTKITIESLSKGEETVKIQTGNPVRGEDFFLRKRLIEQAWDIIDSGNHILIAAPRRVGKTSLMYYLLDNPKDNYQFLYLDIESVNNENEYFRRIVNKLLSTGFVKRSRKMLAYLKKHLPAIKRVGPDGIEFGVREDHDYRKLLIGIINSLDLGKNKLIIMLDEFPQTIENILTDEDKSAATHFLNSNREMRQDVAISSKVQFIYTGSIGLENIVSNLNAAKTINDLSRFKVTPFTGKEAKELIALLLHNVRFDLSETVIDYILDKIEWLIPFYIQTIMYQLKVIQRDEELEEITKKTVDKAISQMLEQRNHFEHWHSRLRASLKGKDYNFVKELLNLISENETSESNEILNLAIKYDLEDTYKELVNSLVYDGYINNCDNDRTYRYNSPILRMWWSRNVAN